MIRSYYIQLHLIKLLFYKKKNILKYHLHHTKDIYMMRKLNILYHIIICICNVPSLTYHILFSYYTPCDTLIYI